MRQTTLSVVLEVVPDSAGCLSKLIEDLKHDEKQLRPGDTERYSRLKWGVPSLHFMSMSVFHGADYDPILVIEVNFDGRPGPFWAQLEATLGEHLRPMLRCCKRPLDNDGPMHEAITAIDSRYPIAPYLERRSLQPSVFHHGNRGLDRARILTEADLFAKARTELAQANPTIPNPYRAMTAQQIHKSLRASLLDPFPWLGEPAPPRISGQERTADVLRLLSLLFVVLLVLSVPGLLLLVFLRAFSPTWADWFMRDYDSFIPLLIIPLVAGLVLYAKAGARRGEAAPSRSGGLRPSMNKDFTSFSNTVTLVVTGLVILGLVTIVMTAVGAAAKAAVDVLTPAFIQASEAFQGAQGFFHAIGQALQTFDRALSQVFSSFIPAFKQNWDQILHIVLLGIYTVFAISLPAILVWLRWLERRDTHHDAPPVDQHELRKMTRREDRIPQNHMGSVVLVKPGVLRMAVFRTGHRALGLALRVLATDGYLGSMRTVHFAHWAFINNSSRLLFISNFDHSWDSYLDDFIEKAHGGLTLAWGSGVGFPATRFLVVDGASHGRQFKAWARHSMAASRFWFSAYADYTVNQIERNARIADGLRKSMLTSKEAAAWARDL
jgi:hypothetical protein